MSRVNLQRKADTRRLSSRSSANLLWPQHDIYTRKHSFLCHHATGQPYWYTQITVGVFLWLPAERMVVVPSVGAVATAREPFPRGKKLQPAQVGEFHTSKYGHSPRHRVRLTRKMSKHCRKQTGRRYYDPDACRGLSPSLTESRRRNCVHRPDLVIEPPVTAANCRNVLKAIISTHIDGSYRLPPCCLHDILLRLISG